MAPVDPMLAALQIDIFHTPTTPTGATETGNVDNNTPVPQKSIQAETPKPKKKDNLPKQQEEEKSDGDEEDEKSSKPKSSKPPNWRVEEDQALCTSWLNTTKDPIVGTDQTKATFWERIHKLFVEVLMETTEKINKKKGFKPFPTQLRSALENRWYHIQHQVSKYCGYYAQVEQQMCSGANNDDVMVEAKVLFKTDTGKNFTLDHCWGILHLAPKWTKQLDEVSGCGKSNSKPASSATTINASTTPASDPLSSSMLPSDASDVLSRPEGQKTAKKRKNDDIDISELIKGQKELLEISRQKHKSFESFADDMVMSKDLSGMDDETLEYFRAKRRKTIDRMKNKS